MTSVRCPSCDAAVPADAAWCTLCFAQLRPGAAAPEPTVAESSVAEPSVAGPSVAELPPVLRAPYVPSHAAPAAPAPGAVPLEARTGTAVVEEAPPSWPCSGCSERVPLEDTVCPHCGTSFLGGLSPNVSLKIPGVGELVGMSAGAKFGVMAGGATVLTAVMVLVMLVLGHIF